MASLSNFFGGVRGAHARWSVVAFADPLIPTTVVDPASITGTLSSTGVYTATGLELWQVIIYDASITSSGVFSVVASNGITEGGSGGAPDVFGREIIVPLDVGDTMKFKATNGNCTARVSLLRLSSA